MPLAICFNLDQSEILSSGNGSNDSFTTPLIHWLSREMKAKVMKQISKAAKTWVSDSPPE